MFNLRSLLFLLTILLTVSISFAQKVAVVDVQKVFDDYQKVKSARERLDKSKKIAMEELEILIRLFLSQLVLSQIMERILHQQIIVKVSL